MNSRFVPSKHIHQIHNARVLQFMRGTRAAAEYLRALGWSIESALYILLEVEAR